MLRFKTGQLVLKSCAIFFESFDRLTTMFLLALKLGFFLSESIQLVSQFFDGFSRLSASHHFLLVSALRLGGKGNLFCQLFGHLRLGLTKFGKLVRGFIKLRSAIKMISTVIIWISNMLCTVGARNPNTFGFQMGDGIQIIFKKNLVSQDHFMKRERKMFSNKMV